MKDKTDLGNRLGHGCDKNTGDEMDQLFVCQTEWDT